MALDLATLNTTLSQVNARWVAADTPFARLSEAEKRARLGYIPNVQAMATARATAQAQPTTATPNFTPAADWRNRNGGNHVRQLKTRVTAVRVSHSPVAR